MPDAKRIEHIGLDSAGLLMIEMERTGGVIEVGTIHLDRTPCIDDATDEHSVLLDLMIPADVCEPPDQTDQERHEHGTYEDPDGDQQVGGVSHHPSPPVVIGKVLLCRTSSRTKVHDSSRTPPKYAHRSRRWSR